MELQRDCTTMQKAQMVQLKIICNYLQIGVDLPSNPQYEGDNWKELVADAESLAAYEGLTIEFFDSELPEA